MSSANPTGFGSRHRTTIGFSLEVASFRLVGDCLRARKPPVQLEVSSYIYIYNLCIFMCVCVQTCGAFHAQNHDDLTESASLKEKHPFVKP